MKKTILTLLALIVAAFGGSQVANLGASGQNTSRAVQVINSHNATSTYLTEESLNDYRTATSSFQLAPGFLSFEAAYDHVGTATMQVGIDGFENMVLGLEIIASTTASRVNIATQISGDGNNWYDFAERELVNTQNASYTDAYMTATGTLIAIVPTNAYATSTVAVPISLKGRVGKFLRVLIGAGGATSTVRAQILLQ